MPVKTLAHRLLAATALLKEALDTSAPSGTAEGTEAALPTSVRAVSARYTKLVETRCMLPLTVYAAVLSPTEYAPRAQLFDMDELADDGVPACRAVIAPERFNPSHAGLAAELDGFFEDVESDSGVAVWTTFLFPGFAGLPRDEFLVLGLVRDASQREAAFLGSPAGMCWLAAEGEALAALVSSAMVVGSATVFNALNEQFVDALKATTVTHLTTAPNALAPPLLNEAQAQQVADQMWRRASEPLHVVETYLTEATQIAFSESMGLLNEFARLFSTWQDRVDAAVQAHRKDAERVKKRNGKDLERLQVAYDGLKARAARQDQLITDLRKGLNRAATAEPPPSSRAAAPGPTFNQSVRGLFGMS